MICSSLFFKILSLKVGVGQNPLFKLFRRGGFQSKNFAWKTLCLEDLGFSRFGVWKIWGFGVARV